LSGQPEIPLEVYQNSVASKIVDRSPTLRTLQFSGYTWNVKASDSLVGPGPNYFSDIPEAVWVDASGRLHLKITSHEGKWYSSEVVLAQSLGYGSYTFVLDTAADQFDPNVVLGLFTWDDAAPQYNYREIDIEISRWGDPANEACQFVVQPYTTSANIRRFACPLQPSSTHQFDWKQTRIDFTSFQGSPWQRGAQIDLWSYTGSDNPPPGAENTRINLWLIEGKAPTDGQEVEVIIHGFIFTPANRIYPAKVAK
jgi:hypothetical protein